jgi:hypothetical protein
MQFWQNGQKEEVKEQKLIFRKLQGIDHIKQN